VKIDAHRNCARRGRRKTCALMLLVALTCGGCATANRSPKWFEPAHFPSSGARVHLTVLGDLQSLLPNFEPTTGLEEFLYGPGDAVAPILRNPQGMAFADGRLLVCDQGRTDIVSLDLRTGKIGSWIKQSDKRPRCPVDIAGDDAGRVYVADTTLKVVLVYGPMGDYVEQLKPDGAFRPGSVLVHNEMLYIGDLASQVVRRWHLVERRWLSPLTAAGSGPRMVAPTGLCTTNDGTLLIADAVAGVVFRFSADKKWLPPIGGPGRGEGQFVRPKQVCVTNGGLICVTDAARQSVQIFDRDGRFVVELHERSSNWRGWTLPMGLTSLGSAEWADLTRNPKLSGLSVPDDLLIVSDSLGLPSLVVLGVYNAGGNDAKIGG